MHERWFWCGDLTQRMISGSDSRTDTASRAGAPVRLFHQTSWPPASRLFLLCVLGYALVLSLSISGNRLWTDEAFSAWLAGQHSARTFGYSLLTGDSSDLQAGLYYTYLFFWTKLFGTGALGLRSANIPFLLIFSFGLVWASWALFRTRVAWVAAGMLPFAWHLATEARAYMAVLALSTVGFAALLGFIRNSAPAKTNKFPWICLTCVFLASMFHMLFLLATIPMLFIAIAAYRLDSDKRRWRQWAIPVGAFTLPFCALGAFFLYTFNRGPIDYNYHRPTASAMASVAYDLIGMSGFGPNRKLSVDFRPFLVPLALGGLAILLGVLILVRPALRKRADRLVTLLGAALPLCLVEVIAFCFVVGKQVDARHLAGMVPIFLFLLIGLISQAPRRSGIIAMLLLGGAWLAADIRAARLPVYQKEDYGGAVRAAVSIHRRTGALIALASDPVGFAYYGLDVHGPAPCYPLGVSCEEAFSRVPWHGNVAAIDANLWTHSQILAWLALCHERRQPVEIVVQLDRAHRDSAWWPVLDRYPVAASTHGFKIVLFGTGGPWPGLH